MTRIRNQSPRMFDRLQSLYNQQAKNNKQFDRYKKQLYYRVIENTNDKVQQRKSRQQQLNKMQNQKINEFWRNQQAKLQDRQRKRKEMILNVTKANQQVTQSTSPYKDPYRLNYNDISPQIQKQRQKKLEEKRNLLYEGYYYADLKRMKEKNQKQQDLIVAKTKNIQAIELMNRRNNDIQRIKDKHQQNVEVYKSYDAIYQQKLKQQNMLQQYIVKKGASQIQNRLLNQALQQDDRIKNAKNQFISELKNQANEDQRRGYQSKMNLIQQERRNAHLRKNFYDEIDRLMSQQKQQENKKFRQQLKGQIRPRSLKPQRDLIEKPGIGSPVHIGKIVNDDRRKQLEWLQKSLQHDLNK